MKMSTLLFAIVVTCTVLSGLALSAGAAGHMKIISAAPLAAEKTAGASVDALRKG